MKDFKITFTDERTPYAPVFTSKTFTAASTEEAGKAFFDWAEDVYEADVLDSYDGLSQREAVERHCETFGMQVVEIQAKKNANDVTPSPMKYFNFALGNDEYNLCGRTQEDAESDLVEWLAQDNQFESGDEAQEWFDENLTEVIELTPMQFLVRECGFSGLEPEEEVSEALKKYHALRF